jgi:putative oxidoreductase
VSESRARIAAVWAYGPILGRVLVALVFAFAAVPKLADPAAFAADIDNYRLVPDALIGPLAIGLPILELLVAAALLTGIHAGGASILALGLLGVFVVGMSQAIARGIDLDCGCFGHEVEARVSGWSIARNVVLCLLLLPGIRQALCARTSNERAV